MRRLLGHPWAYPAVFIGAGIAFAAWGTARQNVAVIVSAVLMVLLMLPYLRATRVRLRPFAQAQGTLDAGGVVVFWRPGCQYCMTLLKVLTAEERDRVHWVNIWQEPEAAAALEGLHEARDGHPHQAVPTAWLRRRDYVVATDATRARLKDTLRQHAGGDA
ncbi:thioredoxin family protein [Micrococcus lacusdianchii]|uniref:thioredoxin family protein n=1 Tax=Micrococcus lacusdianchii TaxID=2915940 RepID=UPI0020068DFC|nr:thioredoxin family protein [Micrococcus sp. JXJ CY 30]